MTPCARRLRTTTSRNSPVADENATGGGFALEDEYFIDREREAAEMALFEGVKATEEDIPFN